MVQKSVKKEYLKKEIESIKERNARVETDKAWEVSWSRRGIIAILTYLVIVLFFFSAGITNPFVNAIVPTMGFLLSTLTLGALKKVWLERVYKK